jgi:hypothetical protein
VDRGHAFGRNLPDESGGSEGIVVCVRANLTLEKTESGVKSSSRSRSPARQSTTTLNSDPGLGTRNEERGARNQDCLLSATTVLAAEHTLPSRIGMKPLAL